MVYIEENEAVQRFKKKTKFSVLFYLWEFSKNLSFFLSSVISKFGLNSHESEFFFSSTNLYQAGPDGTFFR